MKPVLLLFLAPYFLATICSEDDPPVVNTELIVQNETNATLVFVTVANNEIEIPIGGQQFISGAQNSTSAVLPSQIEDLESLVLFTRDADGSLVEAYLQEPIDDRLWTLNDLSDFDKEYVLVITDDLLN